VGCSSEKARDDQRNTVAVGQTREWRVHTLDSQLATSLPTPAARAAALQTWRQSPDELNTLTLAQTFFSELPWTRSLETPAGTPPVIHDALQIRLPSSADGDMELTAGIHLFKIRAVGDSSVLASHQLDGAVFYGPHHFLATTQGPSPGGDSLLRTSRVEEGVVREDIHTPFISRFQIEVPETIRAVRDAKQWLEFLDAHDTPVLRLHYPLARASDGLTRQGSGTIQGLKPERSVTHGMPVYELRQASVSVELNVSLENMQGLVFIAAGWSSTSAMFTPRYNHTTTLLPSGKVLVAGGNTNTQQPLDTIELYDPLTRTWSAAGPMRTPRREHTATLLSSGKVLFVGGTIPSATEELTAEVYDPTTGTGADVGTEDSRRSKHTATLLNTTTVPDDEVVLIIGGTAGNTTRLTTVAKYTTALGIQPVTTPLITGRSQHTATLLPSGKVLLVGGTDPLASTSHTAELYDPAAGNTLEGDMDHTNSVGSVDSARTRHTATLLPSGKVLVIGGVNPSNTLLNTAAQYNPDTNQWTAITATMTETGGRAGHTAVLLPSGKVLVTAGESFSTNVVVRVGSSELFDPDASPPGWSSTASTTSRSEHTATLLPSGEVLVVGGNNGIAAPRGAEVYSSVTGTWALATAMNGARTQHTATLLSTGEVLVAGGRNGAVYLNDVLYNPAIPSPAEWRSTGLMGPLRVRHTATLLASGKVLVVGGENADGALNTALLYDPTSRTWSPTGSLGHARFGHSATLLLSGKVLVVGGKGPTNNGGTLNTAELYDPAMETWTLIEAAPERFLHTATLLKSGKVLIAGGRTSADEPLNTADVYDPAANGSPWVAAPNMPVFCSEHTATLLPSGEVLVAGGWGIDPPGNNTSALNNTLIYSPAQGGSWREVNDTLDAARFSHTATLLPSGKVLVAGGKNATNTLTSSEIYDPAPGKESWSTVSSPNQFFGSFNHTATLLPSGQVLTVGGEQTAGTAINSAQLYEELAPLHASADTLKPRVSTITSSPTSHTLTFTLTGTCFRSACAAGNGTYRSLPSSTPVVTLSAADGSGQWPITVTAFTDTSLTATAEAPLSLNHYLLLLRVNTLSSGGVVLKDRNGPTGTTVDSPGAEVKSPVTLSGSAANGSIVRLYADGILKATIPASGTTTGRWSHSVSLNEGLRSVHATATNSMGNTGPGSLPITFTVDNTPPWPPSVTAPGTHVKTRLVTFNGTAEVGSTVTLFSNGVEVGTVKATNGDWALTPSLVDGTHIMGATATDLAGNTSLSSGALPVIVDTIAPARPSVTSPGRTVNTSTFTLNGGAEKGSTVQLYVDGALTDTFPADATTNTWNRSISLTDGSYSVSVTATDLALNTSPESVPVTIKVDSTPPDAPSVATPSSQVSTSTVPFSGNAEEGSTVRLYANGQFMGQTPANAITGDWNHSITLTDGSYSVHATATDEALNTSPASVSIPVTVDTITPSAPWVTPPTPSGRVKTRPFTLTGGAERSSTVKLYVDGTLKDTFPADAASDTWSRSISLADGSYSLHVTATDGVGRTSPDSDPITIIVDTIAPNAPSVTAPSGWVNRRPFTLTGTAEKGSKVTVYVNGIQQGSPSADANTGAWSLELSLLDGSYTVHATATDLAGNTSADSRPVPTDVDATAPLAPVVRQPGNNANVRTQWPTFSGDAESGSTVTISVDGTELGTAPAPQGTWSFTVPTATPLAPGIRVVTAKATDPANNTSNPSADVSFTVDITAPAAPTVLQPAPNGWVNTQRPTFSGTAEGGSSVTILVDAGEIGTTTSNATTGTWSFTVPTTAAALNLGSHTVTATATDRAGNPSNPSAPVSFTVDIAAPAVPEVSPLPKNGWVNTQRPTFTGTAEAGSTVTISVDTIVRGTAVADSLEHWSFTIASSALPLSEGPHKVTATATDPANNTSPSSAFVLFTVDTAPPGAPEVKVPALNSQVTTRTPVISGNAEPDSTITLSLSGGTPLGVTTASGTGTWSFTVPAAVLTSDGSYTVKAAATDLAGNASTGEGTTTFIVDTLPPNSPVVEAPLPNDYVNTGTPLFQGRADPGSTITLTEGTLLLGPAVTADPSGNWFFRPSPALAQRVYTITVTATDGAGNPCTSPVTLSITVDTTAPATPAVLAPVSGSWELSRTVNFRGTADRGTTVELLVNNQPRGTTVAEASDTWSASVLVSDDGPYTVKVRSVDAAKNSSESSSVSFNVDTEDPAPPRVTYPLHGAYVGADKPVFTGSAEPFSTLTLFVNGNALSATITTDAAGQWRYQYTVSLQQRAHTVSAIATDQAGHVSPSSATHTFTVDLEPPQPPMVLYPSNTPGLVGTGRPTFLGVAEVASTVEIFVDGNSKGITPEPTTDTGTWRFPWPDGAQALPDNTSPSSAPYKLKALAIDRAGNKSSFSAEVTFRVDSTTPAAPSILYPQPDEVLTISQPTFRGTYAPGSILTIYVSVGSAEESGTPTTDASGGWQYTPNFPLRPGRNTVRLTAASPAGQITNSETVEFTVDNGRPAPPEIEPPGAVSTTPTFRGTAEAHSIVTIYVDGKTSTDPQVPWTVAADAQTRWNFTLPKALTQGSHNVQATATDSARNTSFLSAPISFEVDTERPSVPVITSLATGAVVNTSRPTFSGTADALTTVSVFVNANKLCEGITNASGFWSCRVSADVGQGENRVSAIAADQANNRSDASSPILFLVDSEPPPAPEITSPFNDSFLGIGRPTFTGNAEPRSTITIIVDEMPQGTTLCDPTGKWNWLMPTTLPDDPHSVRVIARDAVGNVSVSSSTIAFTVDTVTPDIPVVTYPERNEILGTANPTFAGRAEANSLVTISIDGVQVGTAHTNSAGLWRHTVEDSLNDKAYTLRASATDRAGNKGTTSPPVPFSVDTVSPQVPRITSLKDGDFINDATPTVSGTAEAGSTITITVNNAEVFAAADGTGAWTLTVNPELTDGSYSLTVSSMDKVGNRSSSSLRFTVDLQAPDTHFAPGSPELQPYPATATFAFSSEDESTFDCSFDEADFAPCESPVTLVDLEAGEHTFSVRAVDKAGNKDPEPATFTWTRDLASMEGGGCNAPGNATSGMLAGLTLAVLAAGRRRARNRALQQTHSTQSHTSPKA
jgi:N-acetylneuraminic acid mutarotase